MVTKAVSVGEMAGAMGAATGPFIGSALYVAFGYQGPFVTTACFYLIIFFFLVKYIPPDHVIEAKIEENQKEYFVPGRKYYSLGTRQFYRTNFLLDNASVGYEDLTKWDYDALGINEPLIGRFESNFSHNRLSSQVTTKGGGTPRLPNKRKTKSTAIV